MHMIVRDILPSVVGETVSQVVPGGVVRACAVSIEQSFVDGLLFYARIAAKLDLATFWAKSSNASRYLPNVYGDGRVFHCFHTH
jgi:hypothetical protein